MAPRNVAIIPDGNRRYSTKSGLPLAQAYLKGFQKASEASHWAAEVGVKQMSYWALSLENFTKRSSFELSILFQLMKQHIRQTAKTRELEENKARVKFFGKTSILPKDLLAEMNLLEERTAGNGNFTLNIGIAYSGQEELLNASRQIALKLQSGEITREQLADMDCEGFSKYLYTQFTPDLVIRTGDVQRLSGFLPFQSAYSEYYFSPKLWPEFEKPDFSAALDFYQSTQRRFGR